MTDIVQPSGGCPSSSRSYLPSRPGSMATPTVMSPTSVQAEKPEPKSLPSIREFLFLLLSRFCPCHRLPNLGLVSQPGRRRRYHRPIIQPRHSEYHQLGSSLRDFLLRTLLELIDRPAWLSDHSIPIVHPSRSRHHNLSLASSPSSVDLRSAHPPLVLPLARFYFSSGSISWPRRTPPPAGSSSSPATPAPTTSPT
ncbi:hypothetical protein PGT21_019771 [Puccinia graminis f. sp. tritici]|uniref:Uncharacterized protein n=1 Tax=Puccinia graminis f. sp. tritici TaxID=56615 RepID=A0A5B0QJ26_PUCGR|nr:hypothetical protein PGT21_019771 [Puccinia graminis f. sp. tritici]